MKKSVSDWRPSQPITHIKCWSARIIWPFTESARLPVNEKIVRYKTFLFKLLEEIR